jgi:hypothetical protein
MNFVAKVKMFTSIICNISLHSAQLLSSTAIEHGIRKTEHTYIDMDVLLCIIMEDHTEVIMSLIKTDLLVQN